MEWKRERGRPRECDGGLRYERSGKSGREWITTATDRRSWRQVIENVVRDK